MPGGVARPRRRWNVPTPGIKGRKDEWRTPRRLFDLLNGIFHFTVDAAANADNALLPRYWDREQDALQQDWSRERVWCNPPYSRPGPFLAKAQTAQLAVVLLPDKCLTTHYAHDHPPCHVAVLRGRLSFGPPDGQGSPTAAAPFGSVLFLYGVVTETQINELRREGCTIWRHCGGP
jgi:site-specific DNA-methyltransferase (adenine-specific)